MYPPIYHHYGFVANHALGHMQCIKTVTVKIIKW